MKKIMIIDDEPNFVLLFANRLRAHGFEVIGMLLGKDGVDRILKEKPDLIVLDVRMPEIDGFAVLGIIKQTPEIKHIPVVMVSAYYMDEQTIEVAKSFGARDFFEKTDDLGILVERIQKFCGNPA